MVAQHAVDSAEFTSAALVSKSSAHFVDKPTVGTPTKIESLMLAADRISMPHGVGVVSDASTVYNLVDPDKAFLALHKQST